MNFKVEDNMQSRFRIGDIVKFDFNKLNDAGPFPSYYYGGFEGSFKVINIVSNEIIRLDRKLSYGHNDAYAKFLILDIKTMRRNKLKILRNELGISK